MQQPKFNIGFCTFSYGGNGGISSEVPDIREWMVPLIADIAKDERIDNIRVWNLADTPITMTRNRAVLMAREFGVDILVMIDSDMKPDINAGQPDAKPFFQSSFDYIVENYQRGPVCIGAPYCGPPPNECVYVFRWQNQQNENPNPDFQLEMYDRNTAVKMAGIQECAALPTGLIIYDMRCFDLTEPETEKDHPWFYYEWTTRHAAEKASTEDVTMTRDLSLVGATRLGYNPVLCNWDAWAGHWKPKCVGKPVVMNAASVGQKLQMAWESGGDSNVKLVDIQKPAASAFDSMGMGLPDADRAAIARIVSDFRREHNRLPTVLEVGSWAGASALEFAKAGAALVHCVDHWEGNLFDQGTKQYDGSRGNPLSVFLKNTKGQPITHTVGKSPEVASKFDDESFDIVYIDAEHTEEAVTADITAWRSKAKHVLCGHDYACFEGVKKAVESLCSEVQADGNVWRLNVQDLYSVQEVVS
jgi:hypothetical protein